MRLWKINYSGPGCSFCEFTSGIFSSKTLVSMAKVGCPMIIIHVMAKRFLLKQYPASRGYIFAVCAGVWKLSSYFLHIPWKCSLCSQGTETTSLETNKIVWPFKWDLFGNYFFKWYYTVIENIVLKPRRLWPERYSNIWARLLRDIFRPKGYGFWGLHP